jgi:cytochrome c
LNTFELNKIAGAFLGTLLFAMWLNVISGAIFSQAKLIKPGYPLPAAQETASAGNGAPAPSITPIADRLVKADVKKGETDTKPCQACHNFDKGAGAKIGPPLWGIVDRPKASVGGFTYSDAIKTKGGEWTYDDLDQFLANPKAYAQGTKMAFAGETDPAKRADLIDYLHTLSDNPEPLPASNPAGSVHGTSVEPTLPQPAEHARTDNSEPLPASRSAASPGGASAEPPLPQPTQHANETKPAHPPKLVSHTRK